MVSSTALDLWGDTYTFCLTLLVTWAESFLVLLQCNYGRWTRTPCSDGAGAPRHACLHHPRRRQGRALPPRCQTPQRSSVSSSHWRHSSGGTRTESLRAARPWRCRYCSSHILHPLPSKKVLCCAKFTSRSSLHLWCLLNSFKAYAEAQCPHKVSFLILHCQKPGIGSALSNSHRFIPFQVSERYNKVSVSRRLKARVVIGQL